MSKKKILISIVAIVAVAGLVTTVLFFINNSKTTPEQTATTESAEIVTMPDTSKDYGACSLVTKDVIKNALGESAKSLADGYNTGLAGVSTGDSAQNCVYGLNKVVKEINSTMLTDSFYTTVFVYKDKASKDADTVSFDNSDTINDIGDKAGFFTKVNDTFQTTEYLLRVVVGLRHYDFAIRQTTSTKTFDAISAQAALTTLAKKVNYTQFADKT